MEQEFHSIRRLPPYVFTEVNTLKTEALLKSKDIIDFGMCNPDSPTPSHILQKLIVIVKNPKTHRYSPSSGIKGVRRALSDYYFRRFDVTLDPEGAINIKGIFPKLL